MLKKIIFALRYLYHRMFTGFRKLEWWVLFEHNVTIRNGKYIHIGRWVTLDTNVVLQVVQGTNQTDLAPRLILEQGVGIGVGAVILAARLVHLKRNVMIGPSVVIADYDHAYHTVNIPIKQQPLSNLQPVIIEEGAWIGSNSTICSGVTIGKNAVIGANSVVTKDIPAYSVAVGLPAKVIKHYDPSTKQWSKIV